MVVKVLVTGAATTIGRALIAALGRDPEVEDVMAIDDRIDLARPRDVHDLVHGPARRFGVTAVVHAPMPVEATRALLLAVDGLPTIDRFVFRSDAAVYALRTAEPNLLDEDAAIELDPRAPTWVRQRVEADLTVCARIGTSRVAIDVLRCAEVLAPGTGSQLWDYLQSRVCLRPLGFDPMVNVLSVDDAVTAIRRALIAGRRGIHNIPGADTLPLSALIAHHGRVDLPLPGPVLAPLYTLRARIRRLDFDYDLNAARFHLGGVLDGTLAARELRYVPSNAALPTGGDGRTNCAPTERQRDDCAARRRGRGDGVARPVQ